MGVTQGGRVIMKTARLPPKGATQHALCPMLTVITAVACDGKSLENLPVNLFFTHMSNQGNQSCVLLYHFEMPSFITKAVGF